jgi:hypothetical protein
VRRVLAQYGGKRVHALERCDPMLYESFLTDRRRAVEELRGEN